MRKRILSVLLAGCLLLSVGCSARKNDSAAETTTEASSEVTLDSYYETMPVPEDGWTAEALSKVLYIGGKQITLPFVLEDLDFCVDFQVEETGYETQEQTVAVKVNDKIVGIARVDANTADEINKGRVNSLSISPFHEDDIYCNSLIHVNGITIGCSKEEVFSAMGEPFEIRDVEGENLILSYDLDEYLLSFALYGDDKTVKIIKIEAQ